MTKEDYMKLSKERLAELLAERDSQTQYVPTTVPYQVLPWNVCPLSGGMCTNPFGDCINCPRHQVTYTTTGTNTTPAFSSKK